MSKLLYLIHKHKASRLHYDLRLQVGNVLASWAVPKGPSLNPSNKRLAIKVNDHDLSYGNFEGRIAEGSYGAGTVILWDTGYWEPSEAKAPESQIKEGKLKFKLNGQKLKGGWILLKMKGRGEDNWLFFKEKDEIADDKTKILDQNTSVISGKTIEQIENDSESKVINCNVE